VRAVARPELSEDALVEAIAEAIGASPRPLITGIGDDAAAWQPHRKHVALVTTDMLVDGVHFRMEQTSAADLGHKALAQNLSDIAAMGGQPSVAVVALGVTDAIDEPWVRDFYRSMALLAASARCAIAGGDIVRAPVLTISITVVGEVRRTGLRLRSSARAGDVAAVTGPLGLSCAGLELIEGSPVKPLDKALQAYLRPQPRLREGRFLGSRRAVHAMMDISDGLSTDLARMARASNVDAVVDAAALFVHADVLAAAKAARRDALEYLLNGGDDYELLVAVDARAFEYVARTFRARFGRTLSRVGAFAAGAGRLWIDRDGRREPLPPRGYDHLRK
jgi:thiamine-monophosphate kinase